MTNVVRIHNPIFEFLPRSSVPASIEATDQRLKGYLSTQKIEPTYYVPISAVERPLAQAHGITGNSDVYGGVVEHTQQADKAMLHCLVRTNSPRPVWYSEEFSQQVAEHVLPGYTVFSRDEALLAASTLSSEGYEVRVKDPLANGGGGQYIARDRHELDEVLDKMAARLEINGAVIEANLSEVTPSTVGYASIHGKEFSWHGRPYDILHNGARRFGGNIIKAVQGNPEQLISKSVVVGKDVTAVMQACGVLEAYRVVDARVGRATFDIMQGMGHNGLFLSGVADPSLRPSASSAAEVRAMEEFADDPTATVITSKVVYDYDRSMPAGSGKEIFLAHERLNIMVEIIEKK